MISVNWKFDTAEGASVISTSHTNTHRDVSLPKIMGGSSQEFISAKENQNVSKFVGNV